MKVYPHGSLWCCSGIRFALTYVGMHKNLARFALFLLLLAFSQQIAVPTTVSAAQLSEHLAATLRSVGNDDFVSVLVFMRQQLDVGAEQARYKLSSFSRQAAHKILVDRLKNYAGAEQSGIQQILSEGKSRGDVRAYETYWIANALQVEATKDFIESLRERADIEIMIEDLPMQSLYHPPAQSIATGATGKGVSSGLRAIGADSMWAMGYTGAGRLVATFDTGVNGHHPALRDSYRGNHGYSPQECWFDPIYDEQYPHWTSSLGSGAHGTLTMGVLVGKDDATGDTVGVAFGAEWISAMVVDIPGANFLEAFQWAADPDSDPNTIEDVPDVLSNSWGFYQSNISCMDIFWTAIDNLEALGTVVIFACGNEGPGAATLRNPANRASTIYSSFAVGAVSATNPDSIWERSSRGPSDCDSVSIKPEVVAPGYQVRSTYPDTMIGYYFADGTSLASPHVGGAVALLRQYNPNASVDTIKAALLKSAIDKGQPGEDNTFGHGFISIPAALRLMPPDDQINIWVQSVEHLPIDPGDSVDVIVALKNSGIGTIGVTGELTDNGGGVTIVSGFSNFGDLPRNSSGSNASNPFRLHFAASTPQGSRQTVEMEVVAGGGSYRKTIKLYFTVGTALVKSSFTHVTDSLRFTIGNYGIYGLAPESMVNRGGVGFVHPSGGANYLYQCGLLIGTDSNHVSDGIVNLIGSVDEDFAVAPDGNLKQYTNGLLGDVETISRFSDDRARDPLEITVEQRTASSIAGSDANYVIMQYVITNNAETTIDSAYIGLYCDWDFPYGVPQGAGGYDRTGFARSLDLGYMWFHDHGTYRGTAVLNHEGVRTFFAISNILYIYYGASDAAKYSFLTHGFIDTASSTPIDQSYCIATGPFHLTPGESDTAAFAMIGAPNLPSLLASAQSAKTLYLQATPVEENGSEMAPSAYQLNQNYPNPFNPETRIGYLLPRAGRVTITVYNLLGQRITTLLDQFQPAGNHDVEWDGTDAAGNHVASGVYFYRLDTDGFCQYKKMILLK